MHTIFTLLLLVQPTPMTEVQWSRQIAKEMGGTVADTEYKLPDGSRVDILLPLGQYAWEVEWSDKWPEAIGQSVYYGMATNRKPAVYLLLRGKSDEDYLRCLMVCRKLGIHLRTKKVP